MKRILSLFLAVLMIVSILPTSAFAAGNEPGPGIYDVPVTGLKSKAPIPSIAEKFNGAFGKTIRVVIDENGRVATIVPHHMVVKALGKTYGCNVTDIRGATPAPTTHEEEYHVDGKLAWDPVIRKTSQIPDWFTLPLPAHQGNGNYQIAVKIDYMTDSKGKGFMDVTMTLDWTRAVRDTAAEAAPVIQKISAIGTVTLQSGTAIEAARAAYDALVPESREAVTNYGTLTAAEEQLAALQAQDQLDREAAAKVDAQIQALEPVTLDSAAAIAAAREAYEALNSQARTYVTALNTLTAAEAELARLRQEKLDKDAAARVEAQIAALGEITLESRTAIAEARAAYTALNDQAKTYVKNLAILDQAEAAYADLKLAADQAAAAEVDKKINAIGDVTLTPQCKAAIDAARQAYEGLTEDQKAHVTALDTLTAAEKSYNDQKTAADKAAARAVTEKIAAIGQVTLDSEKEIRAAREAYDALTPEQKALVSNLYTLETVEKQLETLQNNKADLDAAEKVDTQIEALGEITLESKPQVEAARTAYEGLTATQKNLVKKLNVLTAAEQKLIALQKDVDAAAAVDTEIAALGEITLESEKAVQAARASYNRLTEAQKAQVKNLAVLEAAEAKIAQLKQTEADKAAAARVDQQIAAIGEVTVNSKQQIEAARKAYEALTVTEKSHVQRLKTLENSEKALAVLTAAQALKPGSSYMVPVESLTSGAPIDAVKNEFARSFGTEIRIDVDSKGAMTATVLPQHMVVDVNGTYHCNLLKIRTSAGEATYPEMKTEPVTPSFGKPDVNQDIQVPARAVIAMPAYDTAKCGYPFQVTADFMNALNGGMEKDHWMDVVLNLNYAAAERIIPGSEYAAEVDALIAAIGEVTLESEQKITAARQAYNGLTDEAKGMVQNLAALEAAETRLADLKAAAPVEEQIAALGEITLESGEKIAAAGQAFDALTEAQQALVKNADVLTAAEKKFNELRSTAVLAEGSYRVPVVSLTSGAPIASVAEAFSGAFGTEIQIDVDAAGKMTATILPRHMAPVVNGGTYHCNLRKIRAAGVEAAYPEMKTELVTTTFGKPDVTENLEVPGKAVIAMPAYDTARGGYPFEVTADFMNALHGDINADHFMDVLLNVDMTRAELLKPAGPVYEYGTRKTVLKPGLYSLPAALRHADRHNEDSMAASAIKGAYMEVMENGDAFVTVKLGPVNAYGVVGWSEQWRIYDQYAYTDEVGNPGVVVPYTAADVVSRNAGSNVTAMRFRLPFHDQDGVYAQMYVPVVDAWPNAFLALDFAGAVPARGYGPNKNVLAPGRYVVPLAMMHADRHDKPSMAASCLVDGYGVLTVSEAPTLEFNLGPVSKSGLTGWSSLWSVHSEYNTTSATTPGQVLKTDAEGHDLTVSLPVPYAERDGLYVQMHVEVMSADPHAFLKVDYDNAVQEDEYHSSRVVAMIMANLTNDQGQMDGVVTLDEEPAIIATRQAYEALTETQKAMVGDNVQGLYIAEGLLVKAKIADIGEVTLESEPKIVAARKGYDALNEAGKQNVDNLPTLEAAEQKLAQLKNPTIKLYANSLLFEDIIQVKYYFNFADTYAPEYVEQNAGILVWTGEASEYAPGTETYRIEGLKRYTDQNGVHFHGTGRGIPAKNLADMQHVRCYIRNEDGTCTYGDVTQYSPLTYAERMLGKTTTKTSLKKLLVTMLNYGAMAQVNFNYKPESLMNSILSADQQTVAWDPACLIVKKEDTAGKFRLSTDPRIKRYAMSLIYEGAISIKMYNEIAPELAKNAQEMGMAYWTETQYDQVQSMQLENASAVVRSLTHWKGNYYYSYIPGIAAKDLGDTYFAVAYVKDADGVVHYGDLCTYSAHTYAANQINNPRKGENLKNLCKAMVVYSDAASAHFTR